MGNYLADQYSLLHFATGVIAFFWNVPFLLSVIIHALFEYAENSAAGVAFINKYFVRTRLFRWPGRGKPAGADSIMNQLGDNLFFAVGWLAAALLELLGVQYGWYETKNQ